MTLIDTHCHLTSEALAADIWNVWRRARGAGINGIITVATDAIDSARTIAVAEQFDGIWATIGIHPHAAAKVDVEDWLRLREYRHNPNVVAWGEIGLDYHYDFAPRKTQQQIFSHQLELARKTHLPVVVHCREAVDDTIAILDEQGYRRHRIVFHCFTGTQGEAHSILDYGWWLSFTGAVTFRKSRELQQIVSDYPLDQLMLETDAPYMSPEPHRKIRPNEPHLLLPTAAFISQLKGISLEQLAQTTTDNATRFFGLRLPRSSTR